MKNHWSISIACCLALLALHCGPKKPADTHAADEATIRTLNQEWYKAYKANDADAIVALYAEDAVVSPPGAPPARGHAAIRELMVKDMADAAAAGITLNDAHTSDFGVSGDIGWEWGTFTVTDKSGATVDKGKFVSVFARKNGKWVIERDIWNSDMMPAAK